MARRVPVQLSLKSAKLSEDFGLEWASKLFGAEAIDSLPRYERGPNKDKPKGFVIWRKAIQGGWCRETATPVAAGGLVDAWIGLGSLTLRSDAVTGQWLGRNQTLAASASAGFFFAEGRARHAAEQTRLAAEWEAEKAEMRAEK